MVSRGIRNNNPFNIEISANKWQGKKTPSADPVFEQFEAPVWGIRAGVKDLLTASSEGRNTVSKIITPYAPSSENNTKAYIDAVCEHLKVKPDDVLDLDNYETMYALAVAIMLHEQGDVPYSDAIINQGLHMAGVHDTPAPTTTQRPESKVAAGIGSAATIAVVGNTVSALSPTIPLVQQILTCAPWVASALVIIVLAYLGYIIYKKNTTGEY